MADGVSKRMFAAGSIVVLTVCFTWLGETIYISWLGSFPTLYHPYLWSSHVVEVLLIIPLMAFGISLVILAALSKSGRWRYLAIGSVVLLISVAAFTALFLIKSVGTPWERGM